MSQSKTHTKTNFAQAKSHAKKPAKGGNTPSPLSHGGTKQEAVLAVAPEPRRDQTGGGPRPSPTAQGCNDSLHQEGNRLAGALGSRLFCRCRAQEARLDADIAEG
jgi:hypothetical protein